MIITETLEDGMTHTYSDAGFKIQQETGVIYDDAVDVVPPTYTETDIPIENDGEETPETADQNNMIGG